MIDTLVIARRLKEINWTQEQLADEVGLHRKTVNTILSKGEVKKERYLMDFAKALGLPQEQLVVSRIADGAENKVRGNFNNLNNQSPGATIQHHEPADSEYASLRKEIDTLNQIIQIKDKLLESKDQLIELLKGSDTKK